VAVTSDQPLVADAVRTALERHGLDVLTVPWKDPVAARGGSAPGVPAGLHVVLMLCDLDTPLLVQQAAAVARRWPDGSMLLTRAPMGARWGAALDLGVDVVLPLSTTLEELVPVLRAAATKGPLMEPGVRDEFVRQYRSAAADRARLLARLDSLTSRERAVLRLLHLGHPVGSIAALTDVSESTVRSHVRAVLRKLEVRAQIAAVAQLDLAQHQFPWEQVTPPVTGP
jgi:DNA-binding NarL/FixJ family response regulator